MSKDGRQGGARRMARNDDEAGSSSGLGILGALGLGIGVAALAALASYGIAAVIWPDAEDPSRSQYVLMQETHRPMVSETFSNRNILQEVCVVCQELLCSLCSSEQQNIVQLYCGHILHERCLKEMLEHGHVICPTCRAECVRGEIVNGKCNETRSEKE